MNKIFRTLASIKHESHPTAEIKKRYPMVYVFDSTSLCLGSFHRNDVKDKEFPERVKKLYPSAKTLNIGHRNGRITVIRL